MPESTAGPRREAGETPADGAEMPANETVFIACDEGGIGFPSGVHSIATILFREREAADVAASAYGGCAIELVPRSRLTAAESLAAKLSHVLRGFLSAFRYAEAGGSTVRAAASLPTEIPWAPLADAAKLLSGARVPAPPAAESLEGLRAERDAAVERADLQWISVDDRLPEVKARVLFHRGRRKRDPRPMKVGRLYDLPSGMAWVADGGDTFHIGPNCTVTHWMPLPAPPPAAGLPAVAGDAGGGEGDAIDPAGART